MDPRKGIVAIKSHPRSEKILGTGFFVTKGVILTCAHVIEEYYDPDMTAYFQLEGSADIVGAEVVFYSPKEEFDVAILKPKREVEFSPLRITTSKNSKLNEFSIYGYPLLGEISGLNGAGKILGWVKNPSGHTSLQLDSRQVTHGFSGAPVWDEKLQAVVGMLQSGIKAEDVGKPLFALPMEILKDIYPALPLDLSLAEDGDAADRHGAAHNEVNTNVSVGGNFSGNLVIGSNNNVVNGGTSSR
jgi:V8-like Glu-specific endopeptidase